MVDWNRVVGKLASARACYLEARVGLGAAMHCPSKFAAQRLHDISTMSVPDVHICVRCVCPGTAWITNAAPVRGARGNYEVH